MMKYVVWVSIKGCRYYRCPNGLWSRTPQPYNSLNEAKENVGLYYIGVYAQHDHVCRLGKNYFEDPMFRLTIY